MDVGRKEDPGVGGTRPGRVRIPFADLLDQYGVAQERRRTILPGESLSNQLALAERLVAECSIRGLPFCGGLAQSGVDDMLDEPVPRIAVRVCAIARPSIVGRIANDLCTHWIHFDVPGACEHEASKEHEGQAS